ncbi:hypothetical protein [Nocardia sp. NPDC047038]|uniref:hypothetical protein n=1 Tax=Nocardia sp. NPDC047038 TaxID=3154338 RepID=UPI0033E323EF
MASSDTAAAVNDTELAAVMTALPDSQDFVVTDVWNVHEVLTAARDALGSRPFTDVEVWAVEDSHLLVTLEAQPGIRLASESLRVLDTFATDSAVVGSGAVGHVLDQLARLHRSLVDDLYSQFPDIPPSPDRRMLASVVDYLWEVETADYSRQDDDGRSGHILHDLRGLARWLDIATVTALLPLPTQLRGSLRPGFSPDHANKVLSELGACSWLRPICLWDCHDPDTGYHGNPTVYLHGSYQLYQPSARLLAWLGTPADPDAPAPDSPGLPATWIGDIATDIDLAERPDISADACTSHQDHPHNYCRAAPTATGPISHAGPPACTPIE